MPKFEIYYSQGNDWRWRLKASNGEIIAVSEGYSTKFGARYGAEAVKRNAGVAIIVEL